MDETEIVERLLGMAEKREPDQLLETTAASIHVDLYDAAVESFGSWDAALAAALCASVEAGKTTGDDGGEQIERVVGPDAEHPIYAMTDEEYVFEIDPGRELDLQAEPERFPVPRGTGTVQRFQHVGQPEGLVFVTTAGHYYALDTRMVPEWQEEKEVRRLGDRFDTEGDDYAAFVLPRRALYGGRIIHVTRGGKGKATEAADFQYTIDYEPRVAFKLDDGDRPVAVFHAPEGTGIFAASAHGRGIHFPDEELRSMGTRAVGVKVMDLDGEADEIVGAFPGREVDQVAVLTESGRGKRVDFDEFRQQGRAGAGMQLARLDRDDQIAAVAPCEPSDDLAVTTTSGRVHRRPAADLETMGRPAKGNRVLDLAAGEAILDCTRLPCSSESLPGR